MAEMHRHSVQESLNVDTAAGCSVKAALSVGSNADTTNTVHHAVSANASQIGVYITGGSSVFNFSTSASGTDGDCNNANDLLLPRETIVFIKVPRGLGDTIYFNVLSGDTNSRTVRLVEM